MLCLYIHQVHLNTAYQIRLFQGPARIFKEHHHTVRQEIKVEKPTDPLVTFLSTVNDILHTSNCHYEKPVKSL